jgi:hypothetical protein
VTAPAAIPASFVALAGALAEHGVTQITLTPVDSSGKLGAVEQLHARITDLPGRLATLLGGPGQSGTPWAKLILETGGLRIAVDHESITLESGSLPGLSGSSS